MNVRTILGGTWGDVATIGKQASLAEAAHELRERGIGALVVSDDDRAIEGVVSERDIVRALAAHGTGALAKTISSVMSTDVVTCRADDRVEYLMHQMTERRIRHIPVVDEASALTGIISIGDVVKSRLGELEHENQALFDYIVHGR